jgi:peptidoglycan hydrolase-like protein with peptidoglycan-binding domain
MFENPLLGLSSTISPFNDTQPDDVLKTKMALAQTGHYQVPSFGVTPYPDTPMIDGIKKFQQNNGLKVDGIMKPNGPTENALGQQTKVISTINPFASTQEPKKPSAPKPPKIDPLTGLPEQKAPKLKMPTQQQWEQVAGLQKPKTAIFPQGNTVNQRIQSMMTDPRYNDKFDTRLRDHVQKQFEKAYTGKVQYDETGKMVQPTPVIRPHEVEAFDPDGELNNSASIFSPALSITEKESGNNKIKKLFNFESRIGKAEENKSQDLNKVKKLLTLFGHAGPETSDDDTEELDTSIKRFQLANGLKVDGVMKPEGETAKAMEGNIKKLAKQYLSAKGSSKLDDQSEDEWLEDEMNKEDDAPWWEDFFSWLTRLFKPYRRDHTPDGPILNPPRARI